MNPVHDTAYPTLPAEISEAELEAIFTPSSAEVRYVCGHFRQAPTEATVYRILAAAKTATSG